MEAWQRSFQPLTSVRILIISSRTEAKVPRRMTWPSMIANQISTRLSHELRSGVKWMWMRGFPHGEQGTTGPPGSSRYRDVPVATAVSRSTATGEFSAS